MRQKSLYDNIYCIDESKTIFSRFSNLDLISKLEPQTKNPEVRIQKPELETQTPELDL